MSRSVFAGLHTISWQQQLYTAERASFSYGKNLAKFALSDKRKIFLVAKSFGAYIWAICSW